MEKINDPDRCPWVATDPITTRSPRADGWRCGEDKNKCHMHTLYTSDGEGIIFAGRWVLPEDEETPQEALQRLYNQGRADT